jgi:hypothetical protein
MARSTPTAVGKSLKDGALATPTVPDVTGDIIPAGATLLVIAGATAVNVTITPTRTFSGLELEAAGGAVAASTARRFGPFSSSLFAQDADAAIGAGAVLVDYSNVTTVTRLVEL